MKYNYLIGLLIASSIITVNANAFDMTGTITTKAARTKSIQQRAGGQGGRPEATMRKEVVVMKVNMSSKEKSKILNYHPNHIQSVKNDPTVGTLPSKADVGMNGVPVLDQGRHGSCVTFAVTAALDALIGKGDYISQLCNLELGKYLEANSYRPSGWDGSYGPMVLEQTLAYGSVNKDYQRQGSCAGVKEYPVSNAGDTGLAMTPDAFRMVSENLEKSFYWESVLHVAQRVFNTYDHTYNGDQVLADVKKALASTPEHRQVRLTFGTLLPVEHCMAGACARHHQTFDTWALTKAIDNDINPVFGGHQMVITGYDDDAIAIDDQGDKHQGLLTIRNSWGDDVGDKGDFYMTYDYFKKFVLDVEKVTKSDGDLDMP